MCDHCNKSTNGSFEVTMELVSHWSFIMGDFKTVSRAQASLKFYIICRIVLAFWFGLTYDSLEDRRIDEVINYFLFLYFMKQQDFTLSCASAIIDRRCRQNVLRTPLFCSSPCHILTSMWSVLLNRRTVIWDPFFLIDKNAKEVNEDCNSITGAYPRRAFIVILFSWGLRLKWKVNEDWSLEIDPFIMYQSIVQSFSIICLSQQSIHFELAMEMYFYLYIWNVCSWRWRTQDGGQLNSVTPFRHFDMYYH